MKKIPMSITNRLVSYVDRHFTYDWRTLKRENQQEWFDFFGVREEGNHKIVVAIDRMNRGVLWVSIRKNDTYIYSRIVKSYKDIDNFKAMVRCLG